jgi:hypothetical protein
MHRAWTIIILRYVCLSPRYARLLAGDRFCSGSLQGISYSAFGDWRPGPLSASGASTKEPLPCVRNIVHDELRFPHGAGPGFVKHDACHRCFGVLLPIMMQADRRPSARRAMKRSTLLAATISGHHISMRHFLPLPNILAKLNLLFAIR